MGMVSILIKLVFPYSFEIYSINEIHHCIDWYFIKDLGDPGFFVFVGVAGFEPTTSSSRTTRATVLRYTP